MRSIPPLFLAFAAWPLFACTDRADDVLPPMPMGGDSGVVEPDAGVEVPDAGSIDARMPEPDAGPLSKAQARETVGSWDHDWCDSQGWYGDMECDDFCPEPDPDCWSEDDRLAREIVRSWNATEEASCQLLGVMLNDNDGTYYYGSLRLYDSPPNDCEIVAEAGSCFVRRCTELGATEVDVDRELEAGVSFITNQSRGSSNPFWGGGSANTFQMPPRGGDVGLVWRYDGGREEATVPAPSVVSEVALSGAPSLGADLYVDLTYQRTDAEEMAPGSTTRVRITGSEGEFNGYLDDVIECYVPDTVERVRVDRSLLAAIGLMPDYHLRVEAGGYLLAFAEVNSCRAWSLVKKNPRSREHHVSVRTQVVE